MSSRDATPRMAPTAELSHDGAFELLPRWMLRVLSPAGFRAKLTILIFHRVLTAPDPLLPGEPTVADFERQLRWVAAWFNVLPLSEAVERLHKDSLPACALSITFDDGYADNHDNALPVLCRLGLSATFFVATGFLDGGRMFNDSVIEAVRCCEDERLDLTGLGLGDYPLRDDAARRKAIAELLDKVRYLPPERRADCVAAIGERCRARLPDDLMMRSEQIAALRRSGMEVGAHTVSHPILTRIDEPSARREIAEGRERLESILGERVSLFAYPNGRPRIDYSLEHAAIVRSLGFDAAVSTAWGAARTGADPYQLPRFTPWDRSRLRYALRLARTMAQPSYALT